MKLPQKIILPESFGSSPSLIEKAYADRKINSEERILFLVYSLTDIHRLPQQFHSNTIEKCGSWIFDLIMYQYGSLSFRTKAELKKYNIQPYAAARPVGLDSSRSSSHFKVHYSINFSDSNSISPSDLDGNSTPDYVDNIIMALEEVWSFEIDTMDYTPPPAYGAEGGDSKYDVYLLKIESGTYGYVASENLIGDNPNSSGVTEINAATSFMVLRNNFIGYQAGELSAIRITAAHEFFHSIQNGYDVFEKAWMKEAASAWIEDEVYDDINDNYQYLEDWFADPTVPLDATTAESPGHWYGSWIFFRYISEYIGGRGTIKLIWEKSIGYDSFNGNFSFAAINDVLTSKGKTFEQVFKDFTITNLYRTIPPYDYEEGEYYPNIDIFSVLYGNRGIRTAVNRYASMYYFISPNRNPNGNDVINLLFTRLDPATKFGVQAVTREGNTISADNFISNHSLSPTENLQDIYLIVVNLDTTGNNNTYQLEVNSNSSIYQVSNLSFYNAFPRLYNDLIGWQGQLGSRLNGFYHNGIFLLPLPDIQFDFHDSLLTWRSDVDGKGQVNFISTDKSGTIKNPLWSAARVITHNKKIVFTADVEGAGRTIFLSNNGGAPVEIISSEPSDNIYLWQTNYGQVIYSKHFQFGELDTIMWFDGTTHKRPPTSFPNTIPRLDNGKMGWCESSSSNWLDFASWEAYYFNGDTVTRITNDNFRDYGNYPISYYFLGEHHIDFQDGKFVWVHAESGSLSAGYAVLYDGTQLKYLRDELSSFPKGEPTPNIRIDSGKVAWYGYGSDFKKAIFYYDGNKIARVTPANFQLDWKKGLALSGNKIAFPADAGNGWHIYLYVHDTTATDVNDALPVSPDNFVLYQNYPNPFNSTTKIEFYVPRFSKVKITIYNVLGEEISKILDKELEKGKHEIIFDAKNLSSGVMFYRFEYEDRITVRKMIQIK
jgi:hypothetical protein